MVRPRPRWPSLGLAAALFGVAAPSCDAGEAAPKSAAAGAREVSFESTGELRLGFRRQQDVVARVAPPVEGVVVRFALLGDVADAALGASEVTTGAGGEAVISLFTPGREASFVLRARLDDGTSAERGVTISSTEPGAALVEVEPSYGGSRPVARWVAQARPGVACEAPDELPRPPSEGAERPPLTVDAAPGEKLTIYNVPPGEPLSLVLWGGPFALGCRDVPEGVATAELLRAEVPAQNVKLDLTKLDLDVTLSLDEAPRPLLSEMLAVWRAEFLSPFVAGADAESEPARGAHALLGAMKGLIDPANVAGIQTFTAKMPAWKAELAALRGGMPNGRVAGWLVGAAGIVEGGPVIAGRLSYAEALGRHRLVPGTLFGLPFGGVEGAEVDGLEIGIDANDTLFTRGTLSFDRAALFARAVPRFLGVAPGSDAFDAKLLDTVSCSAVASALTDGGAVPAFEGCGASCAGAGCTGCVTELCEDALRAMWQAALAAGTGQVELVFSTSGTAQFDDSLEPSGWRDGSWAGRLSNASSVVPDVPLSGGATTP